MTTLLNCEFMVVVVLVFILVHGTTRYSLGRHKAYVAENSEMKYLGNPLN
jgi:hypothetical protein